MRKKHLPTISYRRPRQAEAELRDTATTPSTHAPHSGSSAAAPSSLAGKTTGERIITMTTESTSDVAGSMSAVAVGAPEKDNTTTVIVVPAVEEAGVEAPPPEPNETSTVSGSSTAGGESAILPTIPLPPETACGDTFERGKALNRVRMEIQRTLREDTSHLLVDWEVWGSLRTLLPTLMDDAGTYLQGYLCGAADALGFSIADVLEGVIVCHGPAVPRARGPIEDRNATIRMIAHLDAFHTARSSWEELNRFADALQICVTFTGAMTSRLPAVGEEQLAARTQTGAIADEEVEASIYRKHWCLAVLGEFSTTPGTG